MKLIIYYKSYYYTVPHAEHSELRSRCHYLKSLFWVWNSLRTQQSISGMMPLN